VTEFAELLALAVVGRIFIFLWMEFPLPYWIDRVKFIHNLHLCDLCSGFYAYSLLCFIYNVDVLRMLGFHGISSVGFMISGGVISFVVHLISVGFYSKFMSVVIE